MSELRLTKETIETVKLEAADMASELMKEDLVEAVLYGSCVRGDYTEDSDIDIALLTRCDRMAVKKYTDGLARIATELAMKYFAVVNFVCLPYEEFTDRKSWYGYFRSIDREGEVLYG